MAWRLKVSQVRPGPVTSAGTAGVARRDLWIDNQLRIEAVWVDEGDGASPPPGVHRIRYTLLDVPPGNTGVLAPVGGAELTSGVDEDGHAYYQGDDLYETTFTPNIATYGHRIELLVDGGGVGRIDRRVYNCRFNAVGVSVNRGWWFPAFNQEPGEANYADEVGNAREWLTAFEYIFLDMIAIGGGSTGTLAGDATGSIGASVVERIRGRNVSAAVPNTNDVLKWDGTNIIWSSVAALTGANAAGTYLTATSVNAPANYQVMTAGTGITLTPDAGAHTFTIGCNGNFGSTNLSTTGTASFGATTATAVTVTGLAASQFVKTNGAKLLVSQDGINLSDLMNAGGVLGDLLYWNATNWTRLPIGGVGNADKVLKVDGGIPVWSHPVVYDLRTTNGTTLGTPYEIPAGRHVCVIVSLPFPDGSSPFYALFPETPLDGDIVEIWSTSVADAEGTVITNVLLQGNSNYVEFLDDTYAGYPQARDYLDVDAPMTRRYARYIWGNSLWNLVGVHPMRSADSIFDKPIDLTNLSDGSILSYEEAATSFTAARFYRLKDNSATDSKEVVNEGPTADDTPTSSIFELRIPDNTAGMLEVQFVAVTQTTGAIVANITAKAPYKMVAGVLTLGTVTTTKVAAEQIGDTTGMDGTIIDASDLAYPQFTGKVGNDFQWSTTRRVRARTL
jgi:hypothetical protein